HRGDQLGAEPQPELRRGRPRGHRDQRARSTEPAAAPSIGLGKLGLRAVGLGLAHRGSLRRITVYSGWPSGDRTTGASPAPTAIPTSECAIGTHGASSATRSWTSAYSRPRLTGSAGACAATSRRSTSAFL